MKKTESAGNYGVILENVIIERHFEDSYLKYIFNLLVLFFGAYGTIMSFLSCYDFGLDSNNIFFQIVLICIVSYIIFQYIKFYRKIMGAIAVILIVICIAYNNTFSASMDTMLYRMNLKEMKDSSVGPGFCILILSAILIMIMAYIVILKKRMIYVALSSLPIGCFGIIFGCMPRLFPLVCIGMYIAAMAAMTGEKIKYRNTSIEYASAAAVLVFLVYVILSLFMPESNYKRIQLFDSIKLNIENINNLPINSFNNSAGGINGGKLGMFDKVTFNNSLMLKLTSGDIGMVYLRGFVGANYSNNSWSDSSQKSGQKILEDMKSQSYEIYNQNSEFFKIIDSDKDLIASVNGDTTSYINNVYKRDFSVENLACSNKFYYLPYGSMFFAKEKSSLDGYPINSDTHYVSSIMYSVNNPDYQKYKDVVDNYYGTNNKMLKYKLMEKDYRNYVYSTYLAVDEKYKKELQKIKQNCSFSNEDEKYEVIQSIKDYLANNYTYTLEPGAVPYGKDFLDYFLFDSKQGYCTYFATAATVFFRSAGIPARYVEGFAADVNGDNMISSQKTSSERNSLAFDVTQSYTQYITAIRDCDAHAWVEIYQDGYGWVPIEVTPGKSAESDLTLDTTFTEVIDEDHKYVGGEGNYAMEDDQSDTMQGVTSIGTSNNYNYIKAIWNFIKFIFFSIVVLFIIGIIIFIPAKISEKKRDKLLIATSDTDNKQKIIMIYTYIERISVFLKFHRPDSMSYIEYYTTLKVKYDYMESNGIDNIISATLKVRFGKDDITRDELNKVMESAINIRKGSYMRLNQFDKLRYRFIYHLY